MYGQAIGYYVNCDDAVCDDCAPAGFADGNYAGWGGFESWHEPIAIFDDSESDTPTHCSECRALIKHALTTEGYRYVLEYTVNDPDGPVVNDWAAEYFETFGPAWFDRFDICEAYSQAAHDLGGDFAMRTAAKLHRLQFRPRQSLNDYNLRGNAAMVYVGVMRKEMTKYRRYLAS